MSTFNLTILAPERKLLQNEPVVSLIITTIEGEIEVLPGHADMISQLCTGRFAYRTSKGDKVTGVISTGFLNVESGSVKVIAETIELAGEIDRNRAKQAQANAEKTLNEAGLDEDAFNKYQLKLQRAIIRQSIDHI
jgi:F-type H+-transporting ATPase subunit epsilon